MATLATKRIPYHINKKNLLLVNDILLLIDPILTRGHLINLALEIGLTHLQQVYAKQLQVLEEPDESI
jgi:hypothetical protein